MLEVSFPSLHVPPNPFVTIFEAENRVSQTEEADKLFILFIDDKETESPAIP
jgi:hypothetical protein